MLYVLQRNKAALKKCIMNYSIFFTILYGSIGLGYSGLMAKKNNHNEYEAK